MKICIIGAGVSGLSLARMLNKHFEVEVLESKDQVGGIARTKQSDGVTYHTVGGHCFNSKHKDVLDFVFNDVMKEEDWHLVERNSKIFFHNHFISYPIEFAISEIDVFDSQLAFNITKELLESDMKKEDNLEDWFISHFGKTLAEEYFIPYNKKIWQIEPKDMSSSWVEGKLPIPSKYDFYKSLISKQKDSMSHAYFYYPNSNNQNTFIENLSKGVKYTLNYNVESIKKVNKKWVINSDKEYDLVINTSPLNELGDKIDNVPENISKHFSSLKYNKITNVLWKTKPLDSTWIYFPSADTKFHRHINIGSFFEPKLDYCITEIMGEVDKDTIIAEGKKIDHLLEPIDYNLSEHAYVIFDDNYKEATTSIKKYLDDIGLYTHGRFGEWEYYNMDVCIKKSIDLSEKLIEGI